MPHLDRYDEGLLDEDDYDDMEMETRLAAEEELRRRDREMGIFRRDDRELFYDKSDDEEDPGLQRRKAEKAATGEVDDEEMIESIENLEDTKGYSIKDWVIMIGPRTEIANRFKNFLRTYVNSKGQYIYKEKIRRMCENNQVILSTCIFELYCFFYVFKSKTTFTKPLLIINSLLQLPLY